MPKEDWIDFAEIRRRVSLEDVIYRLYQIEGLVRQGDKLTGPCPVHGGNSPRAFHADLSRNVWHCFSRCQAGGNQLDFVVRREGISVREAALMLRRRFLNGRKDRPDSPSGGAAGVSTPTEPPTSAPVQIERAGPSVGATPRPAQAAPEAQTALDRGACVPEASSAPPVNPPLTITLPLTTAHPYLTTTRGLKVATLEHFGVGYCTRGILRGMVAFPIHREDGTLVAYAGRRLKPSDIEKFGKYKLPKGFRKELELYNIHRARPLAEQDGLILVEGFFGVLRLFEAGFPTAVAAMGCEVSEAQVALLAQSVEVLVLFDGDEAGRTGAQRVGERLRGWTKVRQAVLPDGMHPDSMSDRALRWLINGMRSLDLCELSLFVRPGESEPVSDGPAARSIGKEENK